jgi:pilus assembly protein CpaC
MKYTRQFFPIITAFWTSALLLLMPLQSQAQTSQPSPTGTQKPQLIQLVLGKSIVIKSQAKITRVSLADPEIAQTLVISPEQIYLSGKAVGTTNLTLWTQDNRVTAIYDIQVSPDVARLKAKLQEILPGENIRVNATHDAIALSGEVSSATKLTQALEVAEAYMPKKVINLLQVAGVNQVMLEVRVAEMSRTLTRRLGFNFSIFKDGANFGLSLLDSLAALSDAVPGAGVPFGLNVSPAVSSILRFDTKGVTITGFIDALKENGLAKILAEPTLVTLSGQEASFLAGGEFPIPVSQRLDAITVEFKTFGVALNFTPHVVDGKKMSIRVAPEVSQLDFSNAVTISGFLIPALTTRRASTVIELDDGQSFAIAGLLNQNVREVVSKYPVLGDIPILGALFRSSSFQKEETELVIIVTPHLVKPLDMNAQTLPTDQFIEPNDWEFYLFGRTEGFPKNSEAGQSAHHGQLDGQFGYILP